MNYESRRRFIDHGLVLRYERDGMSDRQIAMRLGLSHTGFWKIRGQMGWIRLYDWVRSDKGVKR